MKTITILTAVFFILLLCCGKAFSQPVFDYPDNYRHSREMLIDPNHNRTMQKADDDMHNFFFKKEFVFKKRNRLIKPKKDHKREFKDKLTFWEIIVDRLKPKNIFNFTPLFEQLNTPQKMASAVSFGVLMDQDRKLYKDVDDYMKDSRFWKNNGKTLTLMGDGVTEGALSAALYLVGGKKNREVSQMLMEAALSLRVAYIKRIIGYTRGSEPLVNAGLSHNHDSMPSGHTATAFSIATIVGKAYNIEWLMYPLAVMSGLSRLQQNTHWPADVLAGAILGHTEAREILARHNYIPTAKYAESKFWDNTRVDVEAGLRVFHDSYINLESNNPKSGPVGRYTWRWLIDQRLSDNALLQINYHWIGQIPRTVDYNSVEDVLVNPRLAFKISPRAVVMGEYLYNKVQFDDLGRSHLNNRAIIPAGLTYCTRFVQHRTSLGVLYHASQMLDLKAKYSVTKNNYDRFSHLNSTGGIASVGGRLYIGRRKRCRVNLNLNYGYENAQNSLYSKNRTRLSSSIEQKIGKRSRLIVNYQGQQGTYTNFPGNPKEKWLLAGVQFSHSFAPTWNLDAGYNHRRLNSGVPGWSYKKNQYFLDAKYRF